MVFAAVVVVLAQLLPNWGMRACRCADSGTPNDDPVEGGYLRLCRAVLTRHQYGERVMTPSPHEWESPDIPGVVHKEARTNPGRFKAGVSTTSVVELPAGAAGACGVDGHRGHAELASKANRLRSRPARDNRGTGGIPREVLLWWEWERATLALVATPSLAVRPAAVS